jgi:NADH dehydrogenase
MRLAATRSPMKPNEGELPHILIVVGGVAGLILATRLGHSLGRRNLARISLIDRGGERVPAALKVWAAGIRAPGGFEKSGLELNPAGQIVVEPNLQAKGADSIFALGDCASLVPAEAERPLPSTAQVANQQALHLVRYLPAWLRKGRPVPPYRFRDLGALVALSDYNAFGRLGRFGFFKGGVIKGRFAQLSHAVLYRRHQLSLHGPYRAALLWLAERINALVQPSIRIS